MKKLTNEQLTIGLLLNHPIIKRGDSLSGVCLNDSIHAMAGGGAFSTDCYELEMVGRGVAVAQILEFTKALSIANKMYYEILNTMEGCA